MANRPPRCIYVASHLSSRSGVALVGRIQTSLAKFAAVVACP